MSKLLIFWIVSVTAIFDNGQNLVSRECLDCLCEASSGCNLETGCHNLGGSNYFCGPYVISYSYWVDAGRPGEIPDNPLDFESCLTNLQCAETTVEGYMKKWTRDCDRNGQISCNDFARIHKAGPFGCNGTWVLTTDFWSIFKQCYLD
ncbi:lysozyme-like [Tachypleus tridentatus]|uniref:lysozyme-like n=1 Tax=Tachypleus tridentatus TaxID=6853 RepID=UPI003FD4EA14